MSLTNTLIKRETIRLLPTDSLVEYMNEYKDFYADKSLKYVYHFYTNDISIHSIDITQRAVKLAFVDYDSDCDEEPCIELEVPMVTVPDPALTGLELLDGFLNRVTNIKYLPITFGQRCDVNSEYCVHHVGCLDMEHDKKEISIFDPDEYLKYFDDVIENSSLITDMKSVNICNRLISYYCKTIGYKYVIHNKPHLNIKSEQYKILDGKNCVLLTLLHKDYDLYAMPEKELSEWLINFYDLVEQ